jgi:hypothetical protein
MRVKIFTAYELGSAARAKDLHKFMEIEKLPMELRTGQWSDDGNILAILHPIKFLQWSALQRLKGKE